MKIFIDDTIFGYIFIQKCSFSKIEVIDINRIEQLENMYSFIKFEIIHNHNLKNTYFLNLCTLEDNMYGLYSDFLEKLINRLEILIEIQ